MKWEIYEDLIVCKEEDEFDDDEYKDDGGSDDCND